MLDLGCDLFLFDSNGDSGSKCTDSGTDSDGGQQSCQNSVSSRTYHHRATPSYGERLLPRFFVANIKLLPVEKAESGIAETTQFLVAGHIRFTRQIFVHLYDGSTAETLQLVLSKQELARVKPLNLSSTVMAKVVMKRSTGQGQKWDAMVVDGTFQTVGPVRSTSFLPLSTCKLAPAEEPSGNKIVVPFRFLGKNVSIETWREHPDLRSHSPVMAAIFRIRSALSIGTHAFMNDHDVLHLDPNTITGADCEGAGEMFIVTTFGENGRSSVPAQQLKIQGQRRTTMLTIGDTEATATAAATPSAAAHFIETNAVDWKKDFFGKFLTRPEESL